MPTPGGHDINGDINIPDGDDLTYREASDLLFGWREYYVSPARDLDDEWLVERVTKLALALDRKARMKSIDRRRHRPDGE